MKKGSKLYSILNNCCPQCQEGKFWPNNNPYKLIRKLKVSYDRCSHCGLKYEREVGFWYGAMYVSYALGIGFFVMMWVGTSVLFPSLEMWTQIITILVGIVLIAPVNYYLSRIIWINLFVKYQADEKKFVNQKI